MNQWSGSRASSGASSAAAAHSRSRQTGNDYDGTASTNSAATGSSASTAAGLLHGQGPIVYDNLRPGHFGADGGGGGEQQQQEQVARQNAQQQHQAHLQHYGGQQHRTQHRTEQQPSTVEEEDDDDTFVNITEDGILEDDEEETTSVGEEERLYYQYGGDHDLLHTHHHGQQQQHDGGFGGADGMSAGRTAAGGKAGRDVLALLLSGPATAEHAKEEEKEGSPHPTDLATICEEAGRAARKASSLMSAASAASSNASSGGKLEKAAAQHAESAAKYRQAAVLIGSDDAALSRSLLLLSLAQARSASNVLARYRSTCPHPADGEEEEEASAGSGGKSHASRKSGVTASTSFGSASGKTNKNGSGDGDGSSFKSGGRPRSNSQAEQQERLRAKIRGAMDSGSKKEADMTDSMFLVGTGRSSKQAAATAGAHDDDNMKSATASGAVPNDTASEGTIETNPVDDIMKLESELKAMNFATLEMGSSVASIGTRMTSARSVKTNMDAEGSFCVVPGAASYMSSSVMRTSRIIPNRPRHETRASELPPPSAVPGGRAAKPNLVQAASAGPNTAPIAAAPAAAQSTGLESSWWGHPLGASHIMSASISSVSGRSAQNGSHPQQDNAISIKEIMRLLDTVKTLGDENNALMREVEEAQAARHEAMVAKEQMKRFKVEYSRRFTTLKAALDKFRKEYAENPSQQTKMKNHQLLNSDFAKTTSSLESQKKDQIIRQLAAELKKEKEDSKKKDAALRKYETFYREVKVRSREKAKQKEEEQQRLAKKNIDGTGR